MRQLILIAHNLRSTYNVGSILRTTDGLGVQEVLLTGYTPYPALPHDDPRLPHIAAKLTKQISKTALGAETSQAWRHFDDVGTAINELRSRDFTVAALEQVEASIELQLYRPPDKLAIIVGREVEGVENEVLNLVDVCLEIPMSGQKESLNVSIAAGLAMYALSTYL